MTTKLTEQKVMSKIDRIISDAQFQGIFVSEIKVEYKIIKRNNGSKRQIDSQAFFRFDVDVKSETD